MLNWIVRNETLWPYNCMITCDCLIVMLVIHSNTWNYLTVCKQMNDVEKNY